MGIKHIDGEKLYYAFFYGKRELDKRKKHLNKINVFPVPDGDTGSNLVATMQSIFNETSIDPSISHVMKGMADATLNGSRGNSGIIFAQFFFGLSEAMKGKQIINLKEFTHAIKNGVEHAYRALSKPVEGTILTVMHTYAGALHKMHDRSSDFHELLTHALNAARTALRETTQKLKVLENAGVVDAGAEGFVHFIEGITHFFRHGVKPDIDVGNMPVVEKEEPHIISKHQEIKFRYCTEVLMLGENINIDEIKKIASQHGDSDVVAGSDKKIKLHIHTSNTAECISHLKNFGSLGKMKVDDMKREYEMKFAKKASIALVTDSSCDLPQDLMDH